LQLVQLEKQVPSIYNIKGCYFIGSQEIQSIDGLHPQAAPINLLTLHHSLVNYQATTLAQLNELLLSLVQQRCPHQLSAIKGYY
jgi:hypothetical protein